MLGNYFGFFHGVLTDLWISRGFGGRGRWRGGSGEFSVGNGAGQRAPLKPKPGLNGPPGQMTPSWYLNHSASPNVAADDALKFYAIRDIRAEEELTADYGSYSENESESEMS